MDRLKETWTHTWDVANDVSLGHARTIDWLAYEVDHADSRCVLLDGGWYSFDSAHLHRVSEQIDALIKENWIDFDLPRWHRPTPTDVKDEYRYCQSVASADGRFVCLDQARIRTTANSSLEMCDLLGSDDELIHVKWLGNTGSSASHLFAQVEAAATAALQELPSVRSELASKVAQRSDGQRHAPDLSHPTFVLAIANRSWLDGSLYAMARVRLLMLSRRINELGGTLRFTEIPAQLQPLSDTSGNPS